MVPPKQDAFADIFQSATANLSTSSVDRRKNMADLQQQRANNGLAKVNMTTSNGNNNLSNNNSSTWDEFDIFTPSTNVSTNGSRTDSPNNINHTNRDDPFAIFDAPIAPSNGSPSPSHSPSPSTQPIKANIPNHQQVNLLDDEFTDAFHPEPVAKPQPQPDVGSIRSKPSVQQPEPIHPQHLPNARESTLPKNSDERDALIAQLLDIGFSTDMANNAIDEVGMNLQACVNFIMSGGKSRPTSTNSNSNSTKTKINESSFNDLSNDLFNKASLFFNKSKNTVMKNIEQFQQGNFGGKQDNSMPAWMRNQEKYKSQASERNPNGGTFEDYGDDEENIDHGAIREFMELQRQKDKEKNKARLDQFKSIAKEKINGSGRSSPSKSETLSQSSRISSPSIASSRPQLATPVPKPISSQPASPPKSRTPPVSQKEEVDLLGLGSNLTRAERFKASQESDTTYVSSRRRRPGNTSSSGSTTPSNIPRKTTKQPLDQFSQSDYESSKEKASNSFTNGDYDDACINYTKSLNALSPNHELRVVINSNLAITFIKLGNYKLARDHANDGLSLINKEEIFDNSYIINGKQIKVWYTKLLARKAEALEMMESFPQSLECYKELVQLGVNDKKTMDAKRRVNNILNPPPKPTKTNKPTRPINVSNENVKRVQEHNKKQQEKETKKYQLHDHVQSKVFAWSNGKEDNLRTLLIGLPDILPSSLGFPFLTTKKITLNDLMLPKKVKINYMKVISSIHPDKLSSLNLDVEHEMICQAVFITLNKSWDIFKEQNGIN